MTIKTKNRDILVDDTPIERDMGMYSLTHLTELLKKGGCYVRPVSALYRNKSFLRMLSYHSDYDFTRSPKNALFDMKRLGMYKTKGRGRAMNVYCDENVLFCVLSCYSTEVRNAFFKGIFTKILED